MAIKTIMFDLGKVVVYTDFKSLYANFAERIGLTPESVIKYHDDNRVGLFTNAITMEDAWDDLAKIGGAPRDSFTEIWEEEGLKARRIDEGMTAFIKELRKRYKVGAVSNLYESRMKIDERTGVYDNFDYAVLSCVDHVKKPDERFYRLALSKASARPEEALFIDDNEAYVEAASGIGIKGIVYRGLESLKAALIAYM
ncbi:MAG: HAD family phosphatase [Patescibacteria group bacterium]|nr:HAD family phosphatase [Patescibacteria group bacterium]